MVIYISNHKTLSAQISDIMNGIPQEDVVLKKPKKFSPSQWVYLPSWKRVEKNRNFHSLNLKNHKFLIVATNPYLTEPIIDLLKLKKAEAKVLHECLNVNTLRLDHYSSLIINAIKEWRMPDQIIFVLGDCQESQEVNAQFHMIIRIFQDLTEFLEDHEVTFSIITKGIFNVLGTESICLEHSLLIGPCKVLNKEIENIRCHLIDIEIPLNENFQWEIYSQILFDIISATHSFQAAYRGKFCWMQNYDPVDLSETENHPSLLKQGGNYLITGGTGGVGLKFAEYLGTKWNAKLVITSRGISSRSDEDAVATEKVNKTIKLLNEKKIDFDLLHADVANMDQMEEVFKSRYREGFKFDGVIHAAGIASGGFIQLRNQDQFNAVLKPKVEGITILKRLLIKYPVDFIVSFSSLSAILGEIGQADYCSANSFLDAATYQIQETLGIRALSINWARWDGLGMAEFIEEESKEKNCWISASEGLEIFEKILCSDYRQVIVSPYDINDLLQIQKLNPLASFSNI